MRCNRDYLARELHQSALSAVTLPAALPEEAK
jgi:hypothetical protein